MENVELSLIMWTWSFRCILQHTQLICITCWVRVTRFANHNWLLGLSFAFKNIIACLGLVFIGLVACFFCKIWQHWLHWSSGGEFLPTTGRLQMKKKRTFTEWETREGECSVFYGYGCNRVFHSICSAWLPPSSAPGTSPTHQVNRPSQLLV